LERAAPPFPSEKGGMPAKAYNPADFKPGEAYASGTGRANAGHIVLIDEENGSVVGELAEGANVMEDPNLKPGSKNPVEIQIMPDNRVEVRPVDEDYLQMANHPAYKNSSLVQNAAAASRLIVTGSGYISNALASSANSFTTKTRPNPKPMTFTPATQDRLRKIHSFTQGASNVSARTIGQVSKVAQGIGATMAGRGPRTRKGFDENGNPISAYKPGVLNKSLIAFTTIADGIAYSGKNLLTSSGNAATQVVGHRYGAEAGQATAELAGGIKNVGLVYIDVTGVSRRAVIKSVAKGMVVGRVKGGGEVVVGGGDGGVVTQEDLKQGHSYYDSKDNGSMGGGYSDYGGPAPPSYQPGPPGAGGSSMGGALPSKQ
jgi:spartin